MVKPDAKHDYYADLELPATADAEDVKKQFRQLGEDPHHRNCAYSADQICS
jgi:DnaJ-class molecular chaperone